MIESLTDERLAAYRNLANELRSINQINTAAVLDELLAEVHRLRTMPPDVAEAMEEREKLMREPKISRELFNKIAACNNTIAAHFTALFQKGA